jgi:hypothetical protein
MLLTCDERSGSLTGTLVASEALGGMKTVNLISHPHCSLRCEKRLLKPPYILLEPTSVAIVAAVVGEDALVLRKTRWAGRGARRNVGRGLVMRVKDPFRSERTCGAGKVRREQSI